MNVLVYTGPEVITSSLKHTLSTLRAALTPNYTVQTISLHALQAHPWAASCALLVFPGCRRSLTSPPRAIYDYVEKGGSFLGFSTGAQRVGSGLDSIGSLGLSLDSSAESPFRFYDRPSKSYISLCPAADVDTTSLKGISVQFSDGSSVTGLKSHASIGNFDDTARSKILAHFTSAESEQKVAGIKYLVGGGITTFWAVSVEYPITEDPLREEIRRHILRDTLSDLGLRLPSLKERSISRPMPQCLVGNPLQELPIVPKLLDAVLGTRDVASRTHEDENDIFSFHTPSEFGAVKEQSQADYIGSSDSSAWQPKHIIVYPHGEKPNTQTTPLFSIQKFFQMLTACRTKEKCTAINGSWGFGECMLYGEVVTSTQTMIDRNPRLLASLPTPFLSLASFQLTGRGRGNNIWLSPAGCLQFSLLLRVDLNTFPSNKLVFVQYLFALAVAEACRDEMVLGKHGDAVQIKWPNDIYAVTSEGEKKKIGGILVNTNFADGKCDIIIGSGTNVFNPPPIFSLSQLQNLGDPPLNMETTAAVILAKFESMWATFIKGNGSFEPFMNLYLQRWLHSDQVVTLTTATPPKVVRISGITLDYGLLRTVPERTRGSDEGFIDLQPDGNSFDLMAGMIKSKS